MYAVIAKCDITTNIKQIRTVFAYPESHRSVFVLAVPSPSSYGSPDSPDTC